VLRQREVTREGASGALFYARQDALWLRDFSAQEAAPLPRPAVSDGRNGWNRPSKKESGAQGRPDRGELLFKLFDAVPHFHSTAVFLCRK
jgi:hypothetical protein